jgi:type III secretion protein Q
VDVDARLASGLAAILCGGDGDVAPARAVVPAERAALELLALVALGGACGLGPVAALAPRLVRDAAPARGALAVELAIGVGTLRGRARATVSPAALAGLSGDPAGDVPDVRVGAGLLCGTVSLSAEDAAALAPGDVALLDRGDGADALGFAGGLVLAGRLDGEEFTVEERTMNEWNGSFPVALSVEVARVTVALRDLAGLAPGGVLPLDVARDGRVTLRAGDVVVGRGELVEVDGALAVRITAWDPSR